MQSNPFIIRKDKVEEEEHFDEWGGQFSCQERGCDGHANIARYYRKVRLLAWDCQHGHKSTIEGIDE